MSIEFQNRWTKPGFNLIEINLMKIRGPYVHEQKVVQRHRWTLFFFIFNVGFIYKTKTKITL